MTTEPRPTKRTRSQALDMIACGFAVSCVAIAGTSLAIEPPEQSNRKNSRNAHVEPIADTTLSVIQRSNAYQAVLKLPEKERLIALGKMVTDSDSAYAASAGRDLLMISNGRDASVSLVTSRFLTWSPYDQLAVLQAILRGDVPGSVLEIPRFVLRNVVEGRLVYGDDYAQHDTVGTASMILAERGNRADEKLILSVMPRWPRSVGIWLSACQGNGLPVDLHALATTVYLDESQGDEARVAAAASIAPVDADALTFFREQLEAIMSRYGKQSLGTLIPDPYGENALDYRQLRDSLPVLETLRFVPDGIAEPIVFNSIDSPNELIGRTLKSIAVQRWPARLLGILDRTPDVPDINENILFYAAIAQRSPELAGEVLRHVSETDLNAATARIEKGALSVVFRVGRPFTAVRR
jgi:hypothetical protein